MRLRALVLAATLVVAASCGGDDADTEAKRTTTKAAEKAGAPAGEPGVLTVGGVRLKLTSAKFQGTYVTSYETLAPRNRKDKMLIVKGKVIGGGLRKLEKWKVSVVDERGRKDPSAVTQTSTREGEPGRFTFVFVVAKRARTLKLRLPRTSIPLAPRVGR